MREMSAVAGRTPKNGEANNNRDRVRQGVVLAATAVAIVGSLVGSGAFGGTPIGDAAGGALSANATPIAPAVPAFAIWSPIYVGLVAYSIWQLLPRHMADRRQRLLGYPIAASLLLNAAWILSVQAGWLALSVLVIGLLLAVLAYAYRICILTEGTGRVEAVVVDGVVGLYLGWVCVATAANIASLLAVMGFSGWGLSADIWAVLVIDTSGIVGIALALRDRGRWAPTASLCWGLTWVAVARLSGELHSTPAAIAALASAAVVLLATLVGRWQRQKARS